jgi:excisionase family DNA binding protein
MPIISTKNNLPRKNYYRVDEVAQYFSLSTRTIYRLIRQGKIVPLKINHSLRIPAREIHKFERRNKKRASN